MKKITENIILTALYLKKDYTMSEIAVILEVRAEELRAAVTQYEAGSWTDPVPEPVEIPEKPKPKGRKRSKTA